MLPLHVWRLERVEKYEKRGISVGNIPCSQRACDIHERIQLKQNYKQMLASYKRKCGLELYYLVTCLYCLL